MWQSQWAPHHAAVLTEMRELFGFRDEYDYEYRKVVLEMEFLPNSKLATVSDNC